MPTTNSFLLPHFVAGQTLQANDLNLLRDFIKSQSEETRTFLIGSGILHGLEIDLKNWPTVQISRGAGVSSSGLLFALESDTNFQFGGETAQGASLSSVRPNSGLVAKNLFFESILPEKTASSTPKPDDLAKANDLIFVLAFNETDVPSSSSKTCFDTFNKSGNFKKEEMQLLALSQADIAQIWPSQIPFLPTTTMEMNVFFPEIERLFVKTDPTSIQNAADLTAAFKTIIDATATNLIEKLSPPLEATTISSLKNRLTTNAPDQNLYDFLKTLVAAHREWAEVCRADSPTEQFWIPETTAFPNFIVLGSAAGAGRMGWVRPGVSESVETEVDFLKKRLVALADSSNFGLPPAQIEIRLTGSKRKSARLSEQAIPFFFHADVREAWNFCLTKNGRTTQIPHFSSDSITFDLETADFFRIESPLGKTLATAISQIETKRRSLNLPFKLLALGFEKPQGKSVEPMVSESLASFASKNIGLEHLGGVPSGGTFILVFDEKTGLVVADFCLPYFWCAPPLPPEVERPVADFEVVQIEWKSNDKQQISAIVTLENRSDHADKFAWTPTKTGLNDKKEAADKLILTYELEKTQQIQLKLKATDSETNQSDEAEQIIELCPMEVSLLFENTRTDLLTIFLDGDADGFVGEIEVAAAPFGGVWNLRSHEKGFPIEKFARIDADSKLLTLKPLPVGIYFIDYDFPACAGRKRSIQFEIVQPQIAVEQPIERAAEAPPSLAATLNRRRNQYPLAVQALGNDSKTEFRQAFSFVSNPPTAELNKSFARLVEQILKKTNAPADEPHRALLQNLLGCWLDRQIFENPARLAADARKTLLDFVEKTTTTGFAAAFFFENWRSDELRNAAVLTEIQQILK